MTRIMYSLNWCKHVCKDNDLHRQKAVLGKNDNDGYKRKYSRSFVNLIVLSARFLFFIYSFF